MWHVKASPSRSPVRCERPASALASSARGYWCAPASCWNVLELSARKVKQLASAARYSMQPAQTCALTCAFDANIVERWSALTFCINFRVMHCSKVVQLACPPRSHLEADRFRAQNAKSGLVIRGCRPAQGCGGHCGHPLLSWPTSLLPTRPWRTARLGLR